MKLSSTILGSTAVKQLELSRTTWVLTVGTDRFTRAQLAAVGCYNFLAARHLTSAVKTLAVKNLADLYARIAPTDLALPQLGVISLAVLGATFEAQGIGGDQPLESWVRQHARPGPSGQAPGLVTFSTIKLRERAEQARARTGRRRYHAPSTLRSQAHAAH